MALRRIPFDDDVLYGYFLDKEIQYMDRKEKTLREKDIRNGNIGAVSHDWIQDMYELRGQAKNDYDMHVLFWDTLAGADSESALYLVLRYCLGYSMSEISVGMGVSRHRVKYLIGKFKRGVEREEKRAEARAKRGAQ